MTKLCAAEYHVSNTGVIPYGQPISATDSEGFYNYGRMCFGWTDPLGITFWGSSHWFEHVNGIIWPEASDPDRVMGLAKPTVTINVSPLAKLIDPGVPIQAGKYIGNIILANPTLLKALSGL